MPPRSTTPAAIVYALLEVTADAGGRAEGCPAQATIEIWLTTNSNQHHGCPNPHPINHHLINSVLYKNTVRYILNTY